MTEVAERKVDTEVDYVHVDTDPNAYFMKAVDAVTGEEIPDVVEANAVDGWFYSFNREPMVRSELVTERFINDRGLNDKRKVLFRHEMPIALVYKPDAPANLRSHEFRLKAQ